MDKRKTLAILIPTVIIVWGLIIYKIVGRMLVNDEPIVMVQTHVEKPMKEQLVHKLDLDYPDPFLKGTVSRSVAPKKKQVTTKRKPRKKKQQKVEIPNPVLRYNGRIENRTSSEERHMITVNGASHIVTIDQNIDGVTLKKVFSDSVEFAWEKKKIIVSR